MTDFGKLKRLRRRTREEIDGFADALDTAGRVAEFRLGDAMALPFRDQTFDAAVMALVIFFVPDPAKGVAEMARVVRLGGIVSAYVWDMAGGGYPNETMLSELRSIGRTPPLPPSCIASSLEALRELWRRAGLDAVETREIAVERIFIDFEDYWAAGSMGSNVPSSIGSLSPSDVEDLKARLRARLPPDAAGRIIRRARANAVKGRVAK